MGSEPRQALKQSFSRKEPEGSNRRIKDPAASQLYTNSSYVKFKVS